MERRNTRAFIIGLGALTAALITVFVIKPPCLILKFTGFYCPGCGTQRMLWAALRGDLLAAFASNPFMFVALPLVAVYVLAEVVRFIVKKPPIYGSRAFNAAIAAVLIAAAVFTVLRNIPALSFLAPG